MKKEFLNKLNEWYNGSTLQRYEVIKETEADILLFVAYREEASNKLIFEIVRIFVVGDTIQISVDASADDGFNMSSVFRLIKTAVRVA
ncbi:hypothetical protein AALB39_04210 [Lachnospiraceae bacterium 54-53]